MPSDSIGVVEPDAPPQNPPTRRLPHSLSTMPQPPKSASCNYKPVNNLRQTPSVRAASCRNAAEPTSAFASNKAMQPLAHFNAAREDTYKQNKTFRCAQTAGQTQQPSPVFGQLNLIVAPKPNRCSTPHKKANLSPISAPKIEISSQQKVRRSVSPNRGLIVRTSLRTLRPGTQREVTQTQIETSQPNIYDNKQLGAHGYFAVQKRFQHLLQNKTAKVHRFIAATKRH